MIRGLDVSYWQIKMDWQKSSTQDVQFGAARCSVGKWADPSFEAMYNGGIEEGLEMSPYHVMSPSYNGKKITADEQMDFFFETFTEKADSINCYGITIDNEITAGEDARWITAVIEGCFDFVEEEGYKPINYTAKGWWDANVLPSSRWKEIALHVANYPYCDWEKKEQYHTFEEFELYYSKGSAFPKLPRDWEDWQIWQFSSQGTGKLYGAGSNYIDLNLAKDDFFENGEPPPPPPKDMPIELIIGDTHYKGSVEVV